MGEIIEVVKTFFAEDEWDVDEMEEVPVVRVAFQGRNGRWQCYAQEREPQQQFVFYSVCPINVPAEKYTAVAEFITRANYGLAIGNFEMDFGDGEVRYKTSIDVEGDRLTPALVKRLVYANVVMMDEYLPGLMTVVYGEASPQEAIAQIEGE